MFNGTFKSFCGMDCHIGAERFKKLFLPKFNFKKKTPRYFTPLQMLVNMAT